MTAAEIEPVTAEYARSLTDKIKIAVEGTWHLITEAYQSRAWSALGYSSWDDYCTREFGTSRLRLPREERAETVQSLRDAGLSLRAISAATGESVTTVRRSLSGVPNGTPEPSPVIAPVADRSTGEVLVDAEEIAALSVYDDVSEDEFETALSTAREQGDLSRENVVANLPASSPKPVTGTDGKQYKPTDRKPPRKPLSEVAKTRGFALRQAMDSVLKLTEDDRYRTNEKQVADALRGHLLYVAETVAAVLDQLP